MQRLSELLPKIEWDGMKYAKYNDLVGKEIVVYDIKTLKGGFGEFISVLAGEPDADVPTFYFSIGAKVIQDKLNQAKDRNLFPVAVKIVKVKDYFDIE